MPNWAIIISLTITGGGLLTLIINSFRLATKKSINGLRTDMRESIRDIKEEIMNVNQRVDRHLENHLDGVSSKAGSSGQQ